MDILLGGMTMIDYIPSNSVKKYIKDNNITLSDFEKAALIYNARNVTKEDVYAELAELMRETKDKNLKKQIAERLEEDAKILKIIQTGGEKVIYKLSVYYPEDKEYEREGYFATYEAAKKFSRRYSQDFMIEKMKLLFGDEADDGKYIKEDYIPNNPEQYLIVVVDHIKLLSVSTGHQSKQEIDEACDYLIHFRNKCNFTINIVQQFNRNFKAMERRDSNNYLPDLNDLSDSSGPAQAAEVVIAIYHPYREKRARCDEYDIRQLKDRARSILTLKNRFGMADKRFMTAFYGEVGLWKELPLPNQISDYSIYTDLK